MDPNILLTFLQVVLRLLLQSHPTHTGLISKQYPQFAVSILESGQQLPTVIVCNILEALESSFDRDEGEHRPDVAKYFALVMYRLQLFAVRYFQAASLPSLGVKLILPFFYF